MKLDELKHKIGDLCCHNPSVRNYLSPALLTAGLIAGVVGSLIAVGYLTSGVGPSNLSVAAGVGIGVGGSLLAGYEIHNLATSSDPKKDSHAKWALTALIILAVAATILGSLLYSDTFWISTPFGMITQNAGLYTMISGVSVISLVAMGAAAKEIIRRRKEVQNPQN